VASPGPQQTRGFTPWSWIARGPRTALALLLLHVCSFFFARLGNKLGKSGISFGSILLRWSTRRGGRRDEACRRVLALPAVVVDCVERGDRSQTVRLRATGRGVTDHPLRRHACANHPRTWLGDRRAMITRRPHAEKVPFNRFTWCSLPGPQDRRLPHDIDWEYRRGGRRG
jgi:hypothetical protein